MPTKVITTTATVVAIVTQPSEAMSTRLSFRSEQHDADAEQPTAETRSPGASGPVSATAERRDLADDDAERDRSGEQRHRGEREMAEPMR
ncbi:hypothetical protein ACFSEO_00830 [Agromyces cerinus subsp. nitratus]|uniref:hypothetical protein n=1 Tax=Agromyces cerinus TaxID=33878 RepID=UPI0036445E65